MRKTLPAPFFDRPTLTVAKELLGKYLVREYQGQTAALMITEVEAYDGPKDLASHARRGITPRTTIMYGPPGYFYVYFTYGMHWMVNIVTGKKGYPAAILIRAGMTDDGALIKGPARLTKHLKITKNENGKPAVKATGLWLEDRGTDIKSYRLIKTKRIGVDYAGEIWANKLYNLSLVLKNKN